MFVGDLIVAVGFARDAHECAVNTRAEAQPAQIEISGVSKVAERGQSISLKAGQKDDTNSIQEPTKIIPVMEKAAGLGAKFTRDFPPFSITVLELKAE